MTTLSYTCQQILQNLHTSPNQLLAFFDRMHSQHPIQTCSSILQLLSDTLHASSNNNNSINQNRTLQQAQKLATSFNFVVEKCFKKQDKNPQIWALYVQYIATAKYQSMEYQLKQWKIVKIMNRSLALFIQSFQQQMQQILRTLYFKLSTSHRVMLQSLILSCDVSSENKLKFLSETLADYIELGIVQLHRAKEQLAQGQYLTFHQTRYKQYLQHLNATLVYLNCMAIDANEQQKLINHICADRPLHCLVQNCIFIQQKVMSNKQQPIQLLNFKGSYKQQQCFNNIKALGLKILCTMLTRFSLKSTITDFDQIKCLGLMQKLTQYFIKQLSTIKTNLLHLSQNQVLVMSMLQMLTVSSKFLFMNSVYWHQHRLIFWHIIYPLLICSAQQLRQFHDDPQLFIAQAQTLVQKQADDPDKVNSVKTYAGYLLQNIVQHVDGALTMIVNDVTQMIQQVLGIRQTSQAQSIWKAKCSVQAGFTVLQILTVKTKNREDLLQIIRTIFIDNKDKVLTLKKLDRARMLLYLTYNFEYIFKQQQHDKSLFSCSEQYFELVANSLHEQCETTRKVSLFLFQSQCRLCPKFTKIVIDQLIQLIPNTKSIDIFNQLRRTISQILPELSYSQVKTMLQNCVNRLLRQNKQYIHSLRHAQQGTYSNICMIKLLAIIRKIGLICRDLNQDQGVKGKQLMGIIWPVFDLFQYIYQANYDDQLIKLFNTVLSYVKIVQGNAFFVFLPSFAQHHRKNKQLGIMFNTYLGLLQKGQQYLTHSADSAQYLTQIVDNLMTLIRHGLCTKSGHSTSAVAAISLLQHILVKYPNVNYDHAEIYRKSRDLLQERQFKKQFNNVAAVFNLWIIGSCISEKYDLTLITQYHVSSQQGYHAKVFALAINLKVHSLCQQIITQRSNPQVNISKIVYLIQRGIQYLRSAQKSQNNNNNKYNHSKVLGYEIDSIVKINSKQKIRDIFIFMKNILSEKCYQSIIMEVEKIISKQQLRALLNNPTRESRVIFKFK